MHPEFCGFISVTTTTTKPFSWGRLEMKPTGEEKKNKTKVKKERKKGRAIKKGGKGNKKLKHKNGE